MNPLKIYPYDITLYDKVIYGVEDEIMVEIEIKVINFNFSVELSVKLSDL